MPGDTRHADAMVALGPPHVTTALSDGFAFLFEYVAVNEFQAGFTIKYRDVPVLKLVVGRSGADRQAVVLLFDREGLLQACHFRDWEDDLGVGGSVQAIASLLNVVDSGDINGPMAVHDWGRALLESSLPGGLNRAQNLDNGMHGLEQRGTPAGTGQHALEYR